MTKRPAFAISGAHKLLLQSALGDGQTSSSSWNAWKTENDIENIDFPSFRLLPLASKKVESFVPDDPLLSKLKGVYKYNWARNQKILHRTKVLLSILDEWSVPVLLLKGLSMMLVNYQDKGLRYMSDVDILIPETDAHRTIEALKKRGYSDVQGAITSYNPVWHAATLEDETATRFDIHWHALHISSNHDLTQEFWQHAVPFEYEGRKILVLDPTSQLIHVCIHGFSWSEQASIRWVADAHAILADPNVVIDWVRLQRIAERFHFTLILANMLSYLHREFNLSIPIGTIERLYQASRQRWEELEFEARSYPTDIIRRVRIVHCMYLRAKASERNKSMSFLRFLVHYRCLDSLSQLPTEIATWLYSKLRNTRDVTP